MIPLDPPLPFAVGLVGFLTLTGGFASADDLGRAGRTLALICGPDQASAVGPWPGSYYGLPISGAVLAGLGVAALTAHAVARRSRPHADPTARATDDRVRRTSTHTIVAACGVLVAAPLAGSAFIAGSALLRIGCGPQTLPLLGWASLALGGLATVGAGAFAAALLTGPSAR